MPQPPRRGLVWPWRPPKDLCIPNPVIGEDRRMSTAAGIALRHCAVQGYGDEFEPILAEEHPIADEKGGRTEHAAADRLVGVGLQLLLHGGLGNQGHTAVAVGCALAR